MIKLLEVTKVFKSDILTKQFTALEKVSFSVPESSMVGFLGANGAGKTTSLKIIMDFIRPSSGEVIFSEKLGKTKNEILKNIGFLPERPYFYPNLTGNEFLFFLGRLSDVEAHLIKERVKYWAPRFKIEHALGREIKTYSKGMLQRIGFLATILHNPELIILDEPLSGLDPIGRKELKDVIIEVHKEGKTVFFSSHIVPDVEEICDRVIFLQQGKLVFDGDVKSLLRQSGDIFFEIKFESEGTFSMSTPYKLLNDLGNLKTVEVADSDKNTFISELLKNSTNIISVDQKKLSLEEIFYKTRRH